MHFSKASDSFPHSNPTAQFDWSNMAGVFSFKVKLHRQCHSTENVMFLALQNLVTVRVVLFTCAGSVSVLSSEINDDCRNITS